MKHCLLIFFAFFSFESNAQFSSSLRIGPIGDGGSIAVPLGAQTTQYNLDFSGFRDVATDQIGARISELRFNNYANNIAYVQTAGLAFYTNPSGMSTGSSDLQERLRITPLGNIGIGTSIPSQKLHISAKSGDGILIGDYNDPLGWTGAGSQPGYHIRFAGFRDITQNFTGARISALRTNSCCNGLSQGMELALYVTSGASQSGDANLIESMRIAATGSVGIGTTDPGSFKLAVNGKTWTTEVQVAVTRPPDYVFEPTYHLYPLDSIKTFIDKNKHLPEVPSAKEMEKNGVNLGEMNMLLLKKIEELTLYVIELKRENENQNSTIKSISQKIENHDKN